ncbi:unnamed protein product [Rotaria sordida]|uniref:Uncharacterized protein n=1 Tax=Rotaria sordida TaxID=392033 RepID=A0A820H4Z0_9BILA|nr:unnamed protein product [Rotaria sordida]
MIQINLHDSNQQTAVERCESEDVKNEIIESIRYLYPLNSIPNTIEDNGLVYGCEYVFHWIQKCNNGNSNPKTEEIFPLLIKGVETEAHIAKVSMKTVTDIIDELQQTRQRFKHRRERLRMNIECDFAKE